MMMRTVLSVLALGITTAGAFTAPRQLTTGWRRPTELKSSFLSVQPEGAQNSKAQFVQMSTYAPGAVGLGAQRRTGSGLALSNMGGYNANNWNTAYNGHHLGGTGRSNMMMNGNGFNTPSFGYNNPYNGYNMYHGPMSRGHNMGYGMNGDMGAGYGMNNNRRMRGYNNMGYNSYNNMGGSNMGMYNGPMRNNDMGMYNRRRGGNMNMYNTPSFGYNNPYNGYDMYQGPYRSGYNNGDMGMGYGVGNRRRMRGYSQGYNSYNNGPMNGPGYMGNRFNGDRGNMGMRRRRGYDYNTGYNGYMTGDDRSYNSYSAYTGGTYDD